MKLFADSPSGLGQYVAVLSVWGIREGWYVSVIEATESTYELLIKEAVKYVVKPCCLYL